MDNCKIILALGVVLVWLLGAAFNTGVKEFHYGVSRK